jgi:hypothetical protein
MITTESSEYGGVILNGRMVVKPDSSYGGYITRNGAIIDEAEIRLVSFLNGKKVITSNAEKTKND